MYSYYFVPSALPFSMTTNQGQPFNQQRISTSDQSPNEKYLALEKKHQQLKKKYQNIKKQNENLKDYIYQLEDVLKPDGKRKKIKRRTENELSKEFSCPYQSCKKQYASTLALNLHIRNKHKGGTKKERIAYIKQIIQAQQRGSPRPQTSINFCPQLLELQLNYYRQKLESSQSVNLEGNDHSQDNNQKIQKQ